jgi:hypothetical protein
MNMFAFRWTDCHVYHDRADTDLVYHVREDTDHEGGRKGGGNLFRCKPEVKI